MASNQTRKVRVVVKIKGNGNRCSVSESEPGNVAHWIKVHKPAGDQSESVTLSFGDQSVSRRESFEMDYCYEQSENNDLIFTREVKPLISGVFGGCNATIVAYGARGAGKTYLIQGTNEEPGLAVLTMAEILPMAAESGKLIAISFYEIFQDRVLDLLNPKRPEVTVLEAQGKIQLKGLSQVFVKSIEEFQKLYLNLCKPVQKIPNEPSCRSHKGLIVQVFSKTENSDKCPVGKMNFVDLAGYEDPRRKSSESLNVSDNTKINRSVHCFQNVIYALSSKDSHVPYRENKIAHMSKDSLGGINKILMVTCLNPSFCQDSIYMVKLASRSCQPSNAVVLESAKKIKSVTRPAIQSLQKIQIPGSASSKSVTRPAVNSSQKIQTPTSAFSKTVTRPVVHSSQKSQIPGSTSSKSVTGSVVHSSQKSQIPRSASTVMRNKTIPHMNFSESKTNGSVRKIYGAGSGMKGRKLFNHVNDVEKLEPVQEEKFSYVKASEPQKVAESSMDNLRDSDSAFMVSQQPPMLKADVAQETTMPNDKSQRHPLIQADGAQETSTMPDEVAKEGNATCAKSVTEALSSSGVGDENIGKENKSSNINEGANASPPLSVRLQELSNSLKMLQCSTTPLCIDLPTKSNALSNSQASYDVVEPKTPDHTMAVDSSKWVTPNISYSPWQTFTMRSSGVKHALIQDYLKLLNTAEKEDLKKLKRIGEKRATYILELREKTPEPFKSVDDLKDIGLSAKQIKAIMKQEFGEIVN